MNDFAGSADQIAKQLVAGGMEPDRAMVMALRMAQSRQQADESILGGVPTQPPTSDVPPATEILGGDPSRLFQRQPTTMERIKDLPKDVLGAGEALVSMGSLAALAPASMLYALRPGQKTQGDPMEFALRNMYMPRSERGPSHLAGLGEVLESLPQTGPLPELQAFTGVGRGVGRQLAEKGRQAGRAMAPAAANVAEDILSRQGLLMQAAPSGPTRVEAPASPLGFYDPVHQAALNIQRKQGPGQAFLNELQRSENVNKEFLESSGLAEKLRTTPNITREEVQSLAKGAVPEIQEVVKGQKGYQEAKVIAAQDIGETIQAGLGYFDDDHQALLNRWRSSPRGSAEERQAASTLEALLRQSGENRGVNDYIDAGAAQTVNTKYAQYQLPGGENYREVLLTMPSAGDKGEANWVPGLGRVTTPHPEARQAPAFRSPHWEEPNVVSHIRMNDRTDADGKKVLFIEEIQSDWAQEGRKKGFAGKSVSMSELIRQYDALNAERRGIEKVIAEGDDADPKTQEAVDRASKINRQMNLLSDRMTELRSGMPSAPFVQNTKEWVDLSLKNIIKRAVDEGYDRVAFINGTQSADRYDLSKQINMVTAYKQTGGGFKISATDKNGNTLPVQKAKDEAELEGIVGRDLAAKIAAQNRVVEQYSGLDLKVGGEGMKAFYDKLVPERVNAILKRFGGGKATMVPIQVGEPGAMVVPHGNQWAVQYEDGGFRPVRTKEEAEKIASTQKANQIGFDITPAMRERFQKPIPYKQGGSVNHKAVASARRALEKAMAKGGIAKMAGGGSVIGKAAAAAAKQARTVLSPAESEANLQKMLAESRIKERLYHGTTATEGKKGEEAIRRIKPSKEGSLGAGAYLTPQADFASSYAESTGGNVLPVYAQIKKPLIIEGKGDPMIEALVKLGMDEDKASRMVERAYENKGYIGKEVQLRALSQGYDGLMQYRNGDLAEVVVYNPNAIKSAIGNQGTYDIASPELSKAHGGLAHMAGGGSMLGRAAKAGAKAAKAGSEAAERIAKNLQEAADKGQVVATPAEIDRALAASAKRIGKDNPKLSPDEIEKKAARDVETRLKWERIERPSVVKEFGQLVDEPYIAPKARRLQNVPAEVEARAAAAEEFLRQPTEPWQPPKPGLQAFDRSLIKESLEGFPGVEQTRFPRYQPARADIGYVGEMYDNPRNRELIKQQIKRGLPLGGETFYGSLYPLKVAALERGIPAEKFEQFIYQTAPASARNSIMNEMAVGQFLRDMNARGLPLDEQTVAKEMANFKQKYGIGLPLMPVHRQGVQQVIEGGTNLREQVKADIPTNYKIPTYGTQKAGDFGKSVVLDVHEAAGETLGSQYHPYFTRQGGFGPTEYGIAESKMLDIANELGIPGGMAQAGRWFGGGELTGLKSPRGDALDLLEKQTAYTLQGQGIKPTPRNVRNYILDMIDTGQGVLMPYFKSEAMPDVRTMKKKGGAVKLGGLSALRK